MRLRKRIAIAVLATVLAVSMSACGGNPPEQKPDNSGTGDSSISTGGNTGAGTDTGDKKDDPATPPKEDGKEDQKEDNSKGIPVRTQNFFSGKYIVNGKQWTYTVEGRYTKDGKSWTETNVVASDGYRTRVTFENHAGISDEADIYDPQRKVYSRIYDDLGRVDEWPEEDILAGKLFFDYRYNTPKPNFGGEWKIGTYTVDGVTYYSEERTYSVMDVIFCFDKNDVEGRNLRYCIWSNKDEKNVYTSAILKVTSLSNTVDEKLLQVPEGYDLYIGDREKLTVVATGKKTPKDNYPN